MEQLLNEMVQKILMVCEETSMEVEQICNEYVGKILEMIPEPIPVERANYSNETSYINGWNACLDKINNN